MQYKLGDKVIWFKKRRNRDTYDKFVASVVKFSKKQVTIALDNGEKKSVWAENLQVCK